MKAVVEILIDHSGSMGDQGDIRTEKGIESFRKIDIAKRILIEGIVAEIDYDNISRISVRTFSAKEDCSRPEISPKSLDIPNKGNLISYIESISDPGGKTPIVAAIQASVEALRTYMAYEKKIILVTDGLENCMQDEKAWIQEIEKSVSDGIECKVYWIGIGLSKDNCQEAQKITKATSGEFINIEIESTDDKEKIPSFQFYTSKVQQTFRPRPERNIRSDFQPKKNIPIPRPILKDKISDNQRRIEDEENHKNNNEACPPKELDIEELEINENPENNEQVRVASEKHVYEHLKECYGSRVKWLNENGESGSSYDFEIIDFDGSTEYYIECKGTRTSHEYFYMTKSEWILFINSTVRYQVFVVIDCLENPRIIKINNLLEWILTGRVIPCSSRSIPLKAERIIMTIYR